jgi:hypothetical protein
VDREAWTEAPQPERQLFTEEADFQRHIDSVLALAQSEICLFDRNLKLSGLETRARLEALTQFLRRDRLNRIFLVLHEVRHVQANCPRLMGLLRMFGHAFTIHRTRPEIASLTEVLLIADKIHYVRRSHFDHPRGAAVYHDEAATKPIRNRFEEIWEASVAGISATTLGL